MILAKGENPYAAQFAIKGKLPPSMVLIAVPDGSAKARAGPLGLPGGRKRSAFPRLPFFREEIQQRSGRENSDIMPTVYRTVVTGVSGHEGIGSCSRRHLEKGEIVRVG